MTAAVETHGLRKQFGEKLAVEDLTLVVPQGEVFGFLGPNGAGKTTSLKMLLGLVEPSAGSGRVLGAPLGDRRTRARVGFLPEHFRFQEWLTGRELLHFHGRLYGMRGLALDARADELLARVDLLDAAHRPVRTYSKGMMQRVGIAQALLPRPELVLLDEPTSGLDPLGRLLVRDIIRELKAGGATVFLNSHLLGEVEATCDRVVFVKAGRTVHELSLAGDAGGLDVELRTGPLDDGARAALAALGAVEPSADGRARMRVAAEDVLPEVARTLVRHGVALYEMKAARKSLEAWFLEVMGDEGRPG
ncbi:MAG TPA: ABC transporter ATP-binding protein [Candidatus Eisenbacteria bacterium]|jgi:ABC-2 type transport system ATP-binding protein